MSFGGFSWKRALGITSAKRKFARATGIQRQRQGANGKHKICYGKHYLEQIRNEGDNILPRAEK